MIARYYRSRI